jgi:hypothetical protein
VEDPLIGNSANRGHLRIRSYTTIHLHICHLGQSGTAAADMRVPAQRHAVTRRWQPQICPRPAAAPCVHTQVAARDTPRPPHRTPVAAPGGTGRRRAPRLGGESDPCDNAYLVGHISPLQPTGHRLSHRPFAPLQSAGHRPPHHLLAPTPTRRAPAMAHRLPAPPAPCTTLMRSYPRHCGGPGGIVMKFAGKIALHAAAELIHFPCYPEFLRDLHEKCP